MQSKLFSVVHFVVSNPVRLKLAIFAILMVLMVVAVMAPAAVAFAGDATGGSHW